MKQEKNVVILEPSTNTHKIKSDVGIEVENITTSIVKMKIKKELKTSPQSSSDF